jgi:3-oxoacyl-[acyl-carrier-protein] synthase II
VPAAIVAFGAASSLGVGRAAFDIGEADAPPPSAWATRGRARPFGRVAAVLAERQDRPSALLALGLTQLVSGLNDFDPRWQTRRLGVVLGTSSGGFPALELALQTPEAPGELWAKSSYHAPLGGMLRALGHEPVRVVSLYAACASSTLALGLGLRWLEQDLCELVIAGGYDAESDWVCAGFDALKATSSGVPRPFMLERDGMALGEGVALLGLVKSAPELRAFAYLRGFAATTDAVHITAPDRTGQGLARAAEQALSGAELDAREITLVSAHGTGTSFNDAAEAAALSRVFAGGAIKPYLHALKPAIGHTLGAAGALETLAAASALARGLAPASACVGTPMPDLPGRLLDANRPAALKHCLKLSTAFGGANAALVISRQSAKSPQRHARPVYLSAVGSRVSELLPERLAQLLVAPLERLPRGDTLSTLAIAAALEALLAASAAGRPWQRERTGVIVGSVGASLQANAEFGLRIVARGIEHAEPRRFPATSPNACAGHVAIAFGLGGLSHAVGASAGAALEALEVAVDWIAAGDVDALLVIAAEASGSAVSGALAAQGLPVPEQGAAALLLSAAPAGPLLDAALLARARALSLQNGGFAPLLELLPAAGLPGHGAFGSVRPPE